MRIQFELFLWGFAKGANIDRSEANDQWAWHSRYLSNVERSCIENEGYEVGLWAGEKFRYSILKLSDGGR